MSRIILAFTAIAFCVAPTRLRADVLANYGFTGTSRSSTDGDLNSTATTFTAGAGFQNIGLDSPTIDAAHGNPAPSLAIDASFTDGSTAGQSVTANDYFTFTISAASSATFSLTTLGFDYTNYATLSYPAENFVVRSSADGFSSNLGNIATVTSTASGAWARSSVNLAGISSLQNVAGSIEFRIYIYDSSSTAGTGALLDNITLDGLTAVPEPSSWAMLIGGAGLLGAGQRLRQKGARFR